VALACRFSCVDVTSTVRSTVTVFRLARRRLVLALAGDGYSRNEPNHEANEQRPDRQYR
jgi:hypothetical protein